jgi:hypothetical protein
MTSGDVRIGDPGYALARQVTCSSQAAGESHSRGRPPAGQSCPEVTAGNAPVPALHKRPAALLPGARADARSRENSGDTAETARSGPGHHT